MSLAIEDIMFTCFAKDSEVNKTILKNGYTTEQKQKLIKQFEGKSLREVEEWLYKQPQFKSATEEERRKVLNHMWSLSSQGKAQGARRVGERAVIESRGGDVNEYDFNNEVSEKKRAALQPYIDAGVISYEEAVDFARYAGKTYYYENEEGGTSQTYFNKTQMIEYLQKKGYSAEKAEALYNSFKASNAKPYSGSSSYSGRRGYRRRGYGGGGGSSANSPDWYQYVDDLWGSEEPKTKSSALPRSSRVKIQDADDFSHASRLNDAYRKRASKRQMITKKS